ncbi:MAG: hypothetical protein KIT33_04765 [Candidatus Kapabacteria bacterium]|nr:hypothetical protein [Ignavibacteriota bacterium]MCW5884270.1 hypothetical protein [Candidatus Kapabacteria bacterium]
MEFLKKMSDNYWLIIPIITVVLYIQILTFEVSSSDDSLILIDNYSRISDFSGMFSEFGKNYPASTGYKPITMISYYINALISQSATYSYHILNLILHTFISILIFRVILLIGNNRESAFFGSLLFAVSPLIAGNLAQISSRSILLAAVLGLLALIYALKYFNREGSKYIWISGLFVLFAALSDFAGFSFGAVIILYSLVFHKEEFKENFNIIISPIISLVIIWLLLYLNVDFTSAGNIAVPESGVIAISGIYIIQDLFRLTGELPAKFLIPYGITTLPVFNSVMTIVGAGFILAVLVIIFTKFKKQTDISRLLTFGLVSFIIFLLFCIVNIENTYSTLSDYLVPMAYLPAFSIVIILSSLLTGFKLIKSGRLTGIAFLVVLSIYAFISFFNLKDYSNEVRFYESSFKSNPQNTALANQLIDSYLSAGLSGKITEISKSIDKSHENVVIFLKIGSYYYQNKNYESAIRYLNQANEIDNQNKRVLNLLFSSHYSLKDYESAQNILKPISGDTINFPEARWDLFNLYMESHNFQDAGEYGKSTFISDEDKLRALQIVENWSKVFFKKNDNVAVVKSMKTGLEIDPENAVILNYLYDTYIKIGKRDVAKEYEKRLMKIFKERIEGNN